MYFILRDNCIKMYNNIRVCRYMSHNFVYAIISSTYTDRIIIIHIHIILYYIVYLYWVLISEQFEVILIYWYTYIQILAIHSHFMKKEPLRICQHSWNCYISKIYYIHRILPRRIQEAWQKYGIHKHLHVELGWTHQRHN